MIDSDIPPNLPGSTPGREVSVYFESGRFRVWKATFPGQSGFGAFGYYTPAGYLRRLRLANRIFGDDVRFEGIWSRREGPSIVTGVRVDLYDSTGGIWSRREGPSIVTSQSYVQPHPVRFIPTEREIGAFLRKLGFLFNERSRFWEREDGVELCDAHDRNFIRNPDGKLVAIDVQARLKPQSDWDSVIPFPEDG